MQLSAAQCRHYLTQADAILGGLNDEHRALLPKPGAKTAGWLVGHLCVTGDFGRRLCGREPMCPREWRALFNPGSQPSTRAEDYPPMATLCEALRSVYNDLATAALAAPPEALAKENPYEPVRGAFPTTRDFVAYLLSVHLAYHLGQLSTWRAAAGMTPMHRPDAPVE